MLRAFIEKGGSIEDDRSFTEFTAFVRGHIILLSPRVRRAIQLALDVSDEQTHADLAEVLSIEEGRPVSIATVRQRVSRGARVLEAAIRCHRWTPAIAMTPNGHSSVPPPFINGRHLPAITARRETQGSHTYP